MSNRWSEHDRNNLLTLWRAGSTNAEIAEALGKSESTVKRYVNSLREAGEELDSRGSESSTLACDAHLHDLQASGGSWASYVIPSVTVPMRLARAA